MSATKKKYLIMISQNFLCHLSNLFYLTFEEKKYIYTDLWCVNLNFNCECYLWQWNNSKIMFTVLAVHDTACFRNGTRIVNTKLVWKHTLQHINLRYLKLDHLFWIHFNQRKDVLMLSDYSHPYNTRFLLLVLKPNSCQLGAAIFFSGFLDAPCSLRIKYVFWIRLKKLIICFILSTEFYK